MKRRLQADLKKITEDAGHGREAGFFILDESAGSLLDFSGLPLK